MEVLAILRVDNLTCLANVSAKHFLHVTFLQIRIFHEATTSFLAFILFSEIAWSTLHGATIQRKTPAQDWGKCLRAGGLEGLFSWLFRQRLLTSILICATKLIIYMIV
jgi:hypothetical protein